MSRSRGCLTMCTTWFSHINQTRKSAWIINTIAMNVQNRVFELVGERSSFIWNFIVYYSIYKSKYICWFFFSLQFLQWSASRYFICMYYITTVHIHLLTEFMCAQNQLVGAYEGQSVSLHCSTEAYPKSINYWTFSNNNNMNSNNNILVSGKFYCGDFFVVFIRNFFPSLA